MSHLILRLVFILEDDMKVQLTTPPCYSWGLISSTGPAFLKVLRVVSWCLLYAQPYRPGSYAHKAFDPKGKTSKGYADF